MKKTIIYIVTVLLLLGGVIGYFKNELNKKDDVIGIMAIEKQELNSIINKKNVTIKEQDVVILKTKESLKNYTDTIFDLKRKNEKKIKEVISYYSNRTTVVIDSFIVNTVDSIPYPEYITDSFARENMVTVPRTYDVDSANFKFNATVKKEGLTINSLVIPDTTYGRFVELKSGDIKYQFFNTNPYIKIDGANSAVYKKPKKTFWSHVKEKGILIAIGVLVGSQL